MARSGPQKHKRQEGEVADGNASVQSYIAAMPGWKREIGEWLDAIIEQNLPNVERAIKWNAPFYGIEGRGWFAGLQVFRHYVKVAFFSGASLQPLPPGEGENKRTRYLDIRQADKLDEAQMAAWVKQAARLPGFTGPRF